MITRVAWYHKECIYFVIIGVFKEWVAIDNVYELTHACMYQVFMECAAGILCVVWIKAVFACNLAFEMACDGFAVCLLIEKDQDTFQAILESLCNNNTWWILSHCYQKKSFLFVNGWFLTDYREIPIRSWNILIKSILILNL